MERSTSEYKNRNSSLNFASLPSSSTQTFGSSSRNNPSTSSSYVELRPSTGVKEHQFYSAGDISSARKKKKYAYFMGELPLNDAARQYLKSSENQGLSNPTVDPNTNPSIFQHISLSNFEHGSSSSGINPISGESSRMQHPLSSGYNSEHPSEVIPSVNSSAHERPQYHSKKKLPRCRLCANHGMAILLKGHKYVCAYSSCHCHKCIVTRNRQEAMKESIKQERRQDFE